MAEIVRCTDRWERLIVLIEDRWVDHILTRRPEFAGQQAVLEATLTDPAFVNHDRSHPKETRKWP